MTDSPNYSDLGPMRFTQQGFALMDNGYSGSGNWTYWAAVGDPSPSPEPGEGTARFVDPTLADYRPSGVRRRAYS